MALREFFGAPEALPGVLLITGEAGIGKTTLWDRGLELASARSYRVLAARPTSTEAHLSFSALGDLLEPALDDGLAALPTPRRRALSVALLLEEPEGPPPDQRAIALAVLGMMRGLASQGPVVVAVDDAQWLDPPTAFVLEFILRRLNSEAVAFLLTARTESSEADEPDGLHLQDALASERFRRIPVRPLDLGSLHRFLRDQLGSTIPRQELRRVHELSGGNPLFALEIGRALERGSIRLEPGESLPGSLEALVRGRLEALPSDTRAALLVASAVAEPTLHLVRLATDGDPELLLSPAVAGNVIRLRHEDIRFTHPLFASDLYAATTEVERRTLHRRLAELIADPEEHARHLALGAAGPDPDVAAALEEAASHAESRGALTTAAELSERSRRLTPSNLEEDRHRRTVRSAGLAFEGGDIGQARVLLEEALRSTLSGARRAVLLGWLARLHEYEGDRIAALELYGDALAESGDDLALRSELEEGLASCLLLMRTDLPAASAHARTAVELAERTGNDEAGVGGLATLGIIDSVLGRPEGRLELERGVEKESAAGFIRLVARPSYCLANALLWTDELDRAWTIATTLRDRAEEQAEDSGLPWVLTLLSLVEFRAGRWDDALRSAEQAHEAALQVGQESQRLCALGARALLRASRGEAAESRADAEAVLGSEKQHEVMLARILGSHALALLELSLDRPDATHRLLGPLAQELEEGGVVEPGSTWFIWDEIEALIRLDRPDDAVELIDRLEERARRLDRTSAIASCMRCRGLIAASRGDLTDAIISLEGAVAEHERVPIPFEHARTLLALGSTSRRAKRKRAAREQLQDALAIFSDLGARHWMDEARRGLSRIGGRAPTGRSLTPTEQRVAALVGEGRSNKEVAAALFVTVKTVEANLSRIYTKLDVRSRAQLAHVLASRPTKDGEDGS